MTYHREDNIGLRFGEVTIIKYVRPANGSSVYLGSCSCGNVKEFYIGNLRSGKTTSCGCVASKLKSVRSKTHGERYSRLYRTWTNMKSRCYNENVFSYKHYGAKGIAMCDDWRNSYESFRDWSLTNGYSDKLSIDRIDVTGDYSPSNCRWVGNVEQTRNRTITWNVKIDGVTKTAKEWCDLNGVSYKTAHTRKYRGWDDVDAVTTPTNSIHNYKRKIGEGMAIV